MVRRPSTAARRHRRARDGRSRGLRSVVAGVGVVVLAVGLVLAAAVGGYPASRPRLLSGAAWLASAQVGQLTLLDGSSVEVAAQVQVAPKGNRLDVVQQAATAYAVDRTAGSWRRVDGATFELSPVLTPIPDASGGLLAFAGPHGLYALDSRRGVLAAADPHTLAARGGLVSLASQVDAAAATVDDSGRLWLLDTTTGNLIWLDGGTRHIRRGAVTPGAGLLTLADGAPVLVDTGRRTADLLDPATAETRQSTTLDLRPGERVAVAGDPHASRLYLVAARGVLAICELTEPNCTTAIPLAPDSTDLGTPVETGGRVFVPDYTTGRVWVIDLHDHRIVARPQILHPQTKFQLLTRDGLVFFNDPDSEHAGVIRLNGGIRTIAKYDPKHPDKALNDPDTGIGNAPPADDKPPVADDRSRKDPTKPPTTGPPPPPGPPLPPPTPTTPPVPPPPDRPTLRVVVSNDNPFVGDDTALQATGEPGRAQPTDARWDFADGQNAGGLTVSHQWGAAGTYQVSVQATFPDGQTAAASITIRVVDRPVTRPVLTVQPPANGTVNGDGGISCPPSCSATFDPGQTVSLTAAPAGGFVFAGWGGDCGGGNPTCNLTMTVDRTVSAAFTRPSSVLTVQPPSNGRVTGDGGINCPGTCTATFNSGDSVSLTAQPANPTDLAFTGWGGACAGRGNPCNLTMNGDQTVSASFAVRPTLTVDNFAFDAGTVTGPNGLDCPPATTCTVRYDPGQQITITATPSSNVFTLINWEDDCASAPGRTCTLTMNGNKKATPIWGTCFPSCGGGAGTGFARLSRGGRLAGGPGGDRTGGAATIGRRTRPRRARIGPRRARGMAR